MSLNISPKVVNFTGISDTPSSKTRRDRVEDAAAATGGVGAGYAATRGSSALKFFKQGENLSRVTGAAASATKELEKPANQVVSLFRACKVNYKNITKQIAQWAEKSSMPTFMKGIFTGKLGKMIGGGAAVFVFISGVGEVLSTAASTAHKLGNKVSYSGSVN